MKDHQDHRIATQLRELLPLLRHDLAKPEATVRMFVDILDEIKNQPEELARWKGLLTSAFKGSLDRLLELEKCLEDRPVDRP
jgi:hypothetical protein